MISKLLQRRVKSRLRRLNQTQRELSSELEVSYPVLNGVLNGSISSLKTEIILINWLRNDSRNSIKK